MSQTDKFFDHSEVEFAAEAMRKAGVIYDDLFNKLCRQIYEDVKDAATPADTLRICNNSIVHAEHIFVANFPDNYQTACQQGCSHCCHFPVQAAPQDIVQLALHLKLSLSDAELADLNTRLQQDIQQRSGAFMRAPCPLLTAEQSCSVYEHRPLVCRMFSSQNAFSCEQSLTDGRQISQRPLTHRIFQAAVTALLIAAEQQGMYKEQGLLIPGLLELLTETDAEPSDFCRSWKPVYLEALNTLQAAGA